MKVIGDHLRFYCYTYSVHTLILILFDSATPRVPRAKVYYINDIWLE